MLINNSSIKIYDSYRSCFKDIQCKNSFLKSADKISNLIKRFVLPYKSDVFVLDLGCGSGEVLYALNKLGFKNLHGCDISKEQIALTSIYFPNTECKDIFDKLKELKSSSVSIIILFDVLEHIKRESVLLLLKECRRVLHSEGILIGHCPNGFSPFFGSDFWSDPTHEWCYTPKSIDVIARISGFSKINHIEHLGASPTFLGFLRSLLWIILKVFIKICNKIETNDCPKILTRNFCFILKP